MLATETVVVLGVVSLVAEQFIDALVRSSFDERRRELWRIDARAHADEAAEQKMRCEVANDGELRVRREFVASAESPDEVATDVPTLESGGVDRSAAALSEQAYRAGYRGNRLQQGRKRPL